MNELTIGDKVYISSKRAAELTGYAKDYVGQLCREGHVEAKMVGRSWYVLESSIREHRFGKPEEKVEETKAVEPEKAGVTDTWESATYIPEASTTIPTLVQSVAPIQSEIRTPTEDATLTEMQAAWKEWFKSKNEPLLETPEIIEAREEEYEREHEEIQEPEAPSVEKEEEAPVPIAVHRIPDSEPVHRTLQPVHAPIRQPLPDHLPLPSQPRRKERSSMVMTALLVAVAGLTIAIALVGSGLLPNYANDNPIVRYLGGERSIEK